MKATGMKTAMMEKVVAATAMPISAVPSSAAVRLPSGRSKACVMRPWSPPAK